MLFDRKGERLIVSRSPRDPRTATCAEGLRDFSRRGVLGRLSAELDA